MSTTKTGFVECLLLGDRYLIIGFEQLHGVYGLCADVADVLVSAHFLSYPTETNC